MMATNLPTQEEVFNYMQSLSNWGSWGADDQLGTLNLLTPELATQAAGLVKDGVAVTCARPIISQPAPDVLSPPLHYMVESGEGWDTGNKVSGFTGPVAMDFIGMVFHGYTITHLDALSHGFSDGTMYNGQPAHLVSTNLGATVESVDLLHNGIVGRGVLLDIPRLRGVDWLEPGDAIMPEDLDAAEKAAGVQVREGDLLLIRTGSFKKRTDQGPWNVNREGLPGAHAACLPWFHERGISVLGSDGVNDVMPSGYSDLSLPIHRVALVAMGLWLIDDCNLEDLARACAERNRWEFLLTLAPLRIHNGTGSPINPIALF